MWEQSGKTPPIFNKDLTTDQTIINIHLIKTSQITSKRVTIASVRMFPFQFYKSNERKLKWGNLILFSTAFYNVRHIFYTIEIALGHLLWVWYEMWKIPPFFFSNCTTPLKHYTSTNRVEFRVLHFSLLVMLFYSKREKSEKKWFFIQSFAWNLVNFVTSILVLLVSENWKINSNWESEIKPPLITMYSNAITTTFTEVILVQ